MLVHMSSGAQVLASLPDTHGMNSLSNTYRRRRQGRQAASALVDSLNASIAAQQVADKAMRQDALDHLARRCDVGRSEWLPEQIIPHKD